MSRPTGPDRPPAGADLLVNITLRPNLNPVDGAGVSLVYVVNWGQEQELAAAQEGPAGAGAWRRRPLSDRGTPLCRQRTRQCWLCCCRDVCMWCGAGHRRFGIAVLMALSPPPCVHADGELLYTAAIPAAAFKAGDMVRWRARAADTAGYRSALPRPPPSAGTAAAEEWPPAMAAAALGQAQGGEGQEQEPHYYGTAIAVLEDQVITPDVPILEW